jgi:hypothetical protein
MLQLFVDLGMTDDPATSRARLDEMLATPDGRARLRRGIEDQQDHFDMLGLQLGFAYASDAIVPDGSAPPSPANPVRDFVATARPGSRLPHVWVERAGSPTSILDLLDPEGFTLLAGPDGSAWSGATASAAPTRIRCLVADRDFVDRDGAWRRASGIEPSGALLVRPDQHVAWRVTRAPVDPAAELAAVVRRTISLG